MFECKDKTQIINERSRWKYFLAERADVAQKVIKEVIAKIKSTSADASDPFIINRTVAQLKNVSAVPEDFDVTY